MIPNFLIVGAAKSGTTSLYYYLSQHPDIFMPRHKEPDYFVEGHGLNSLEEYQLLFGGFSGRKAVGEASTSYLYAKEAPERIRAVLDDVRIIIVLRNPVDMAYSLYSHMKRTGLENHSFEEALADQELRLADPAFKNQARGWYADRFYIDRAKYFGQVKRYLDTFGKDRVHIELFEDLKANAGEVCERIFQFLGVAPDVAIDTSRVYNPAGVIKSPILHKLANDEFLLKSVLKKVMPMRFLDPIKERVNRLNVAPGNTEPMQTEARQKLEDVFLDDIEALENLIARDLGVWKAR